MTVLVFAPHADDEVLGCGGTIRRLADEGRTVHVCIVTEGYTPYWSEEHLDQRADEIADAASKLGVSETHELGYPAAKLDTVTQKELNDDITAKVSELDSDTVLLPHSGDLHRDHQLVHEAGLVACRPQTGVDRVFTYETLSETEWGTAWDSFEPTTYVDISETLDTKCQAMHKYRSEVREFPHPRSIKSIKAHATKRGSEAHMPAAEAFSLVRSCVGRADSPL